MSEVPKDMPAPDEHDRGLAWLADDSARLNHQPRDLPLRCPCCGCHTLVGRGRFEICPVCFWEDDGQDDHDADVVRGGPNADLSLIQARANYLRIGACDEPSVRSVRPPKPEELPEHGQAEPAPGSPGG